MKTIGLIGGTTWHSTLEYYRLLNEAVGARLGGVEAARILLFSFNYGDIDRWRELAPDQEAVRPRVVEAARRVEGAGAHCLALCANTLHWFADGIEAAVAIPLIHIADATAAAIRQRGFTKVGLLGTRPTMEQTFYTARLATHGVEALVPDPDDRTFIHQTIMTQLVHADCRPDARARFLAIMDSLAARGAQGIILGCTEIPLLVKQNDTPLPLFDTLALHCDAIVEHALRDE